MKVWVPAPLELGCDTPGLISMLSWAGLICRTHQRYTTASDCQTPNDQIPDQPVQLARDRWLWDGKTLRKVAF